MNINKTIKKNKKKTIKSVNETDVLTKEDIKNTIDKIIKKDEEKLQKSKILDNFFEDKKIKKDKEEIDIKLENENIKTEIDFIDNIDENISSLNSNSNFKETIEDIEKKENNLIEDDDLSIKTNYSQNKEKELDILDLDYKDDNNISNEDIKNSYIKKKVLIGKIFILIVVILLIISVSASLLIAFKW